MAIPSAAEQLQFLSKIQRLLSDGLFVSTYKFALLLALADCAVERGDDQGTPLALTTSDLAEKFVDLYWKHVAPWVGTSGSSGHLRQATGREAAILRIVQHAHGLTNGLMFRLHPSDLLRLRREIAGVIAIMPLWRLQTIGGRRDDFLYPNVGRGHRLELRGEAVYCLREFYPLVKDLVQSAWVRFIERLPRNATLIGQTQELRDFLFGVDRAALASYRAILLPYQEGRCFYCERAFSGLPEVDHFIPWSRYPLDLGHNFVLAHKACNMNKADRLAATEHLEHWTARNGKAALAADFREHGLAHNLRATIRIASWAYEQAERAGAQVWVEGREGLQPIDEAWRRVLPPLR
jgi:hypothetical protein